MWVKIIAFIVGLMVMVITNTALGQPVPIAVSDPIAVVAPVKKGSVVPFDGVLYSPLAVAHVIAERDAAPLKIKIEVDRAVALTIAQYQFKFDLAAAAAAADHRVATAAIDSRDARIKFAEQIAADTAAQHKHNGWKVFGGVVGGFVAGAVITTAIVFGVNQASSPQR